MRKSKSDYPDNWNDIAMKVKQEAGWKCVRCGHGHDPRNGYCLTVHHLDLDPANCEWWNIPALCQRCHLNIQSRVIMEQPYMFEHSDWFKPHVAGYYASKHGHNTSREYVEANMDELLRYGDIKLAPRRREGRLQSTQIYLNTIYTKRINLL